VIEYLAYATASASGSAAMSNNPVQVAAYDKARQAEPPPFELLRNAYRPTVFQRDRWMSEDLGIPNVPEDTQ
jgi:hypothetical protein